MSLTAINWCWPVHDIQLQLAYVPYPGPDEGDHVGSDLKSYKSPYPCDQRSWTFGDDHTWEAGGINPGDPHTPASWTFKIYTPLCNPRWALWGYQDRSAMTPPGSNRQWIGPTIGIHRYYPAWPTTGIITYSYGGTEIITISCSAVDLGVIPDLPLGGINGWTETLDYVCGTCGVPLQWIGTFQSQTTVISDPGGGPAITTRYGSYCTWDGLPDDVVVKDPVYWGGGYEQSQWGPIYGFNYDGPIADPITGTDSSGNRVEIQELSGTATWPIVGTYSEIPYVFQYFYSPRSQPA